MKHIVKIDIPIFPAMTRCGKRHIAIARNNILDGKSAKYEFAVCLYSFTGDLKSAVSINLPNVDDLYPFPEEGFAAFATGKARCTDEITMIQSRGAVHIFDSCGDKQLAINTIGRPSVGIDGSLTIVSEDNRLQIYAEHGNELVHDTALSDLIAMSTLTYSQSNAAVIGAHWDNSIGKKYRYELVLVHDGIISDKTELDMINIHDALFCGDGRYIVVRSRMVVNYSWVKMPATIICVDRGKIKQRWQIWKYKVIGMTDRYPIAVKYPLEHSGIIGILSGDDFIPLCDFRNSLTGTAVAGELLAVRELYDAISVFDTTFNDEFERLLVTKGLESI